MFPSWLFELLSILAIASVLIPAPFHIKAQNYAAVALLSWLLLDNTFKTVNSFVWKGNVDIKIPVWCDIGIKINIGGSIALPAACLCINRFLASISSSDTIRATKKERRKRLLFDLSMCYGLPVVFMILHVVFQGHRFNIIENIGCSQYTYNNWGSIIVFNILPLVLAVLSVFYGSYASFHLLKRRYQCDDEFLRDSTNFTPSRFYRLLGLTSTLILINLAFNIMGMIFSVTSYIGSYESWGYVHKNFSHISQLGLEVLSQKAIIRIQIIWLLSPVASYIFFAFFGFGFEARKEYLSWYQGVKMLIIWCYEKFTKKSVSKTFNPPTYEDSRYSDGIDYSLKDITGKTGVDFDQYELPFLTNSHDSHTVKV